MPQSLQTTLDFLEELRFNNHKTWFDENRKRYEQARSIFEGLIGNIMQHFGTVEDLGDTTVKECLYRINRDIRFSKDKTPYQIHMAALIANGGRKSTGRSYYVHIQPGGSFVAGGIYSPTPEQLQKLRHTIAQNPRRINDVLANKDFVRYFGKVEGEKLKTAPKGYASDHPAIELLKHKQFLASHPVTDAQVLSDGLVAYIVDACRALKPFVAYIDDALQS